MESTRTVRTTVRLPEYAVSDIKQKAKKMNISMNSLLSMLILDGFYYEPNEETIAAIEECRSGVELEDFDPKSLDQYIYANETKAV